MALVASDVRSARAVARFAVYCRCADTFLPLADRPAIAQRHALGSPDFVRAHTTLTLLIVCMRALRAPFAECLPLLQVTAITGKALIGHMRTVIERSGGHFALKVEKLFAMIADQYTRSPNEAAAAVHATGAALDGMFMQCASPLALGALLALTRGLVEELLDVTRTPAPELGVLIALRDVAAAIPFAFAQLDAFALIDVAAIALAFAAHIGDAIERNDDEEALRVGAGGFVFLTHLATSPPHWPSSPLSPTCPRAARWRSFFCCTRSSPSRLSSWSSSRCW
jgi:hypothetical protein